MNKYIFNQRILLMCLFAFILSYILSSLLFKGCSSNNRVVDTIDSTAVDTMRHDSLSTGVETNTIETAPEPIKVDSTIFPDYVYSYEYIEVYEKLRPLISAMVHTESRGIPNLESKSGKYHGILQQSKISVDDCNQVVDKPFSYEDRKNPKKSIQMFLIYQKRYNKNMTFEMACRIWSRFDLKGTNPEAEAYWKKVEKEIGKHDYSHLWEQ